MTKLLIERANKRCHRRQLADISSALRGRRTAGAVQRFKQIAESLEPLMPGVWQTPSRMFHFGQRGRLPSAGALPSNGLGIIVDTCL